MFGTVTAMLRQRSFDELGTPLSDVTFCVVDLETTGGSPHSCAITEIGAVKVRRGEVTGTFQTLVDPGCDVPAYIRVLTGITHEMLAEAPPIESVLPAFLEFVRGSVLVAHNARFDVGFLNAALGRSEREPLANRVVDTAQLARKILAGEVPNNRLATLAAHLRCPHTPCHRAFADVLATCDVLHHLIERASGFGVTTIEDLLAVSASRIDGTFTKIELTRDLPRDRGIYRFLGASGQTLYVGKATDLRTRVRSYFYGDPRRKIRDLLRETQSIAVERHDSMLEAEVAEARVIARELPPYNRAGKRTASWFVKVELRRGGRIAAARVANDRHAVYLGPFSSLRVVRTLLDALRDGSTLHRCTTPSSCTSCPSGQTNHCSGKLPAQHRREVASAAAALLCEPDRILARLQERLSRLALQERFEEAAEARDRAHLLEKTLRRHIEVTALVDAGDVVLESGGRLFLVRAGTLAASGPAPREPSNRETALANLRAAAGAAGMPERRHAETVREARVIVRWIVRNLDDVRLVHVSGVWAEPAGARPGERFRTRGPESDGGSGGRGSARR